jgi:hypothetical protein
MATYDLGTIGLTVQNTGAQQATQEVQKLGAAAQKVMDDFKRMQAVLALAKKGTDDAAASFRRLSVTELQQASKQMRGFEAALANTRRGMGQMGMATQQIGYQVGDFLVQIQSGTNFMVAFGQQATQLVGILPAFSKVLRMPIGRLIGISSVLGIVIPLVTAFGAAWMRTSESVKEGADKQKQAYDSVKQSIESLQLARQMEASGAQTQSEQSVLNTLNAALKERQRLLEESLALEYASTNEASLQEAAARAELSEKQRANRLAILENEELLKSLGYQRELDIAAKRRANEKRDEYRQALALRIEEEKAEELARRKKDAFHAMAGEMAAVSSALFDANGFLESMSPLQREIYEYGQQFAQTDLASGVDAAAAAALALAERLGISLDRAKGMMALGYGAPVVFDPRDPNFDPAKASAARAAQLQKDRFGFTYGTTVTGTKFADDKKRGGDKKDPLEELRQQIKLENELLGVSEAQARVFQALGMDRSKYSEAEINAITAEIEAYNQKQEAIERTKQIMDTVKSSMEEAFMSMVDGTKSAKDAFKDMAAMIIKELYRILVVQQLVNSIAGFIMPSAAPASSPRPQPRPVGLATGGSLMAGRSYLVGENGPELVMPRHSGTVVNANQTAGAMGGSGGVTVQNNISVTGSDAAMVRAEVAKMIPQITNATKAAVIDARLRGGQMKAAFT